MDLAFITPTKYLEKFSKQGTMYLALAHLVDDNGTNNYARFHRREAEKGRKVILDNGLFEGAQVDPQSLIRRARAIRASVVCAPDVLYDSAGTVKEFKSFIKLKHEEGLVCDVMGIPQADNPDGWWDCFRFMDLSKECQLIGLSILSVPASFKRDSWKRPITDSRMHLIRQLHSYEKFLGRPATNCHMLGLGEALSDITLATRLLPDTIISNDSSSAYVHGARQIRYSRLGDIPGGKDHKKLDFNAQTTLFPTQEEAIQYNIDVALTLSGNK